MKWFKHFSDAKYDVRMRRLINMYGIEGYGLYFAVIESIAFGIERNNPMPDLEDNAHDIAEYFGMDTVKVEEIMKYCIELKLFEYNEDTKRLLCFKMLHHLDNAMSQNPEIKQILDNFKSLEITLSNPKNLSQIRLDKNRKEKKKKREPKKFTKPAVAIIKEYCDKKSYNIDAEYFFNYYESKGWLIGKSPMKSWKAALANWNKRELDKRPRPVYEELTGVKNL